jgi:hypothetical protein
MSLAVNPQFHKVAMQVDERKKEMLIIQGKECNENVNDIRDNAPRSKSSAHSHFCLEC